MPDLREQLEDAYAREREVRDYAMLGLPHEVCGIQIHPLTLRSYLLLSFLGNPFVVGGGITVTDAAQFLWILSVNYLSPDGGFVQRFKSFFRRKRLMRKIAAIHPDDLFDAISDFMDEMFMDCPGGRKDGPPRSISLAAELVNLFRGSVSRSELLESALPEIWQHLRYTSDPKAPVFNKFSDRVKSQFLASLNNHPSGVSENG